MGNFTVDGRFTRDGGKSYEDSQAGVMESAGIAIMVKEMPEKYRVRDRLESADVMWLEIYGSYVYAALEARANMEET